MGLSLLKFLKLKFSLLAIDKILIPIKNKGNIFRGAFGLKFKELNCKSTPICIDKCIEPTCLYSKIFEPHYTKWAPSGMKDIPRPFILTYTNDSRIYIYPGESFNIGFNLFGWACNFYGHFITTIKAIGEEGIGPLRGRYEIKRVYCEDEFGNYQIIMDNNGVLKEAQPFSIKNSFEINSTFLKLLIKTPAMIKYESQIINQPEFYHIFLRLRDRISAIAYFHNGIELQEDFKLLELEAREVRTIKSSWQTIEIKRRSSKTHLLHDLSGVVGYAIYDFKTIERIEMFAPWLKIGEIVNVGKNSVWGMGSMKTTLNWKMKEKKFMEVKND